MMVQRYRWESYTGRYGRREWHSVARADGKWIQYGDHAAAITEAEQRGRELERAAVVAWARDDPPYEWIANAIEAGLHVPAISPPEPEA